MMYSPDWDGVVICENCEHYSVYKDFDNGGIPFSCPKCKNNTAWKVFDMPRANIERMNNDK